MGKLRSWGVDFHDFLLLPTTPCCSWRLLPVSRRSSYTPRHKLPPSPASSSCLPLSTTRLSHASFAPRPPSKARECLSFAAEKATSSIQRTSKDGASDRLLAQATTANETLQGQLSAEAERLRLSEQHLHDLKLQVSYRTVPYTTRGGAGGMGAHPVTFPKRYW